MTRLVEVPGIDGGVVVGDDGSECAAHAVRYAADEARRRNAPLHVVRAWTVANAPRPSDWSYGHVPSLVELEAATREKQEARVAELVGASDLTVTVHTPHAQAAEALISASKGADVMVVGDRGRGGFASLRLGSTADQVAHHAGCPVVVVKKKG